MDTFPFRRVQSARIQRYEQCLTATSCRLLCWVHKAAHHITPCRLDSEMFSFAAREFGD